MPTVKTSVKEAFAETDKTCLVMIDRSMWFAKSYEALAVADSKPERTPSSNPKLLHNTIFGRLIRAHSHKHRLTKVPSAHP